MEPTWVSDDGDIVLYLGDCLEVLPILANVDVVVTDPPFNINYHYQTYKDAMSEDDYYDMLCSIFEGRAFVVVHYPENIYKLAFQLGLFPERVVSWVYNSNTQKQHRDIAFFGIKPDFRKYKQPYKNPNDKRIAKRIAAGKAARLYDWWEVNQVKNVSAVKTKHPCQMPLEIMQRVVNILPEQITTILDPFMGSGTTGVACVQTGRKFIGIEIDKNYFDIAVQRIQQALAGRANTPIPFFDTPEDDTNIAYKFQSLFDEQDSL